MRGAAGKLADMYGRFDVVESTVTTGVGVSTQLVLNDSTRIGLIFGFGGTTVNVSTLQNPAANGGFQLNASSPVLPLSHLEFGPLVQVPWFGKAAGAAPVNVLEIFLRRDPEDNNDGENAHRTEDILRRLDSRRDSILQSRPPGDYDKRS